MRSQSDTYFCIDAFAVVAISGADARDFLQRTTSQDFRSLSAATLTPGAFLTGTGGVIGTFLATQKDSTFYFVLQKQSLSAVLAQIEKLHFGEDLAYGLSDQYGAIEWTGENLEFPHLQNVYLLPQQELRSLVSVLRSKKVPEVNHSEWIQRKIRTFHPVDQQDFSEANIILEAGCWDYVHRNKGCYPGQEVIERIYTYGNIPRKFVQLVAQTSMSGGEIYENEQKIGRITSEAKDDSTYVANGYLLRVKASLGVEVTVKKQNGESVSARVAKVSQDLNKDAVT